MSRCACALMCRGCATSICVGSYGGHSSTDAASMGSGSASSRSRGTMCTSSVRQRQKPHARRASRVGAYALPAGSTAIPAVPGASSRTAITWRHFRRPRTCATRSAMCSRTHAGTESASIVGSTERIPSLPPGGSTAGKIRHGRSGFRPPSSEPWPNHHRGCYALAGGAVAAVSSPSMKCRRQRGAERAKSMARGIEARVVPADLAVRDAKEGGDAHEVRAELAVVEHRGAIAVDE